MQNVALVFDSVMHTILADISRRTGRPIRGIEREAAEVLEAYSWPGNTQEMYNVLEAAALKDPTGMIRRVHLPKSVVRQAIRIQACAMARLKNLKKTGEMPRILKNKILSKKGLARLLEFSYSS